MSFEPFTVSFGVTMAFMLLGLIGVFVPILPGPLLMWFAALVYSMVEGFHVIGWGAFYFITLIGLLTGTADIWLPLLGAKAGGAGVRSVGYGIVGSIIGLVFLNLIGAVVGYALGILVGEYRKHRNAGAALKAGVGGVVGWGLSTAVEFIGAVLILIVFVWRVLSSP